ncbi:hypothetical protein GCM10023333_23930 [Ferrimonas pelagia]|uniref:GyrI-like small molecule binding domain-containing protein n=2 Tax=Ferrimonas pelagia TaxID=1177826 RepID=A0ABP9F4V6_9GAMM
MNCYYDGEYKEQDAQIGTCLPVKKPLSPKVPLQYQTLQGGEFACLIHKGSYDSISDSYAALFRYLHQHNRTLAGPSREIYLKGSGMLFKGNPDNYLTELQFPLKPAQN